MSRVLVDVDDVLPCATYCVSMNMMDYIIHDRNRNGCPFPGVVDSNPK